MSHHREPVDAPGAPAAVGPYVHAVRAGNLVFCSGQIPHDPESRELDNLASVADAAGASLDDAVRITVYLTDMASWASVNDVYAGYFESGPPARVAIGVAALPRGAQVEMDCVLAIPS